MRRKKSAGFVMALALCAVFIAVGTGCEGCKGAFDLSDMATAVSENEYIKCDMEVLGASGGLLTKTSDVQYRIACETKSKYSVQLNSLKMLLAAKEGSSSSWTTLAEEMLFEEAVRIMPGKKFVHTGTIHAQRPSRSIVRELKLSGEISYPDESAEEIDDPAKYRERVSKKRNFQLMVIKRV